MNLLAHYYNGNTEVYLLEDGTKIRMYDDSFPVDVEFPESIDVKITNYCDMGCPYCHEQSTLQGQHGDLNELYSVIKDLPKGIELAIGGGNPLSHPSLISFLRTLIKHGFVPNITIHQNHIIPYKKLIETLIEEKLVFGIGISMVSRNFDGVIDLMQKTNHIVFHVIAGIANSQFVDELSKLPNSKILMLGYKQYGFGKDFFSQNIQARMQETKEYIKHNLKKINLSFDNLAIEQLEIKNLLSIKEWDMLYMGNDFEFTMYIDAVEKRYAPTSRSEGRVFFTQYSTAKEYFIKERKKVG